MVCYSVFYDVFQRDVWYYLLNVLALKICCLIFFLAVIFSVFIEKQETTGLQTPRLCWISVPYYCFSCWFCICIVPTASSSGMLTWMCVLHVQNVSFILLVSVTAVAGCTSFAISLLHSGTVMLFMRWYCNKCTMLKLNKIYTLSQLSFYFIVSNVGN